MMSGYCFILFGARCERCVRSLQNMKDEAPPKESTPLVGLNINRGFVNGADCFESESETSVFFS